MSATEADIRELYDRYGSILFHRCRSILKDEELANDAVQETFAKVIVNWESFREDSSPLTWMYRISTNYCLNQVRNRKGRSDKRELHREAIVGEGFTRPDTARWEKAELVRQLMEDADEETQAIVTHLFFDDMTREETAVLVGISVPTLRKRLNAFLARARKRLPEAAIVLGAFVFLWLQVQS